jgi:hypothetical protein
MAIWSRRKDYADAASSTTTTISFDEGTPLNSTYLLVAFIYTDAEAVAVPSGWTSRGTTSVTGIRLRILSRQADGIVNGLTVTSTAANAIHQVVLFGIAGYVSGTNANASGLASGTAVTGTAPAYSAATSTANLINFAYALKNTSGAFGLWDSGHDSAQPGDRLSVGLAAYTTAGQNQTPTVTWSPSATFRAGQLTFQGVSADAGGGTLALTNTTAPAITGTATTGSVLTVSNGAWSATPDSYTYAWKRAGTAITGATAATYTLVLADEGQAITCTVTAIKATYTSGTTTSNAVTPPAAAATAPGQVTGLTAISGSAHASLSWTAPANGGAAITDYLIEYQPSGGSWTAFTHTASTATTATVTDLTNGTAYLFRVSAINSVGTGFSSATATATPAAVTAGVIPPNDANIVYSPYTWMVNGSVAQTVNSGAYLRTVISGSATSIIANFDTTGLSGTMIMWARIDDAAPVSFTPAASVTLTIPTNNWTKHTVELMVQRITGTNRWNSPPTSTIKFLGFTVAPTSAVTRTTRRRPYNILCYGDSILEGYGTLASGATDARFGWGFSMRDLLGAEIGCVGVNAVGLTKPGESNFPAVPTHYTSLWSGQGRSFTSPAEPNLILINLGTNDNGADISTAAVALLNGLLAATTTSKIAVIQQYNGTLYKTAWQEAVAACSTPARVTYVDTTGWLSTADTSDNTHPYGYINVSDLSPRVAAAVAPLISGVVQGPATTPKRFINVGGVAKTIG